MALLTIGDQFPAYKVTALIGGDLSKVNGPDELFTTITSDDYAGKWRVVFFWPKDFTFICPTEITEFNRQLKEFKDRDCEVVGGSTDNEYSHLAWCQSHEDLKQLKFPLIAAQKLAADLGILDPEANVCLRATFVVDPQGVIQYATANSLSVGRNVQEILRVLDAVQSDELCPCNWKPGEEFIKV